MKEDGYSGWWFPPNISANYGQTLDQGTAIITWVTMIGGIVVIGLMLFAVIRYRYRPDRKALYLHGNFKFETTMLVLVTVFTLGGEFFVLGEISEGVWDKIKYQAPEDAMEIEVLAEQFAWNIRYPGDDGQFGETDNELVDEENPFGIDEEDPAAEDDVVTRGLIHVPVNVPVKVKLRSKDVIHSFFIPVLRIKQDALPGETIDVWFQAKETGEYHLVCAELCGLGHTTMKAGFVVEPLEEFQSWLEEKSEE